MSTGCQVSSLKWWDEENELVKSGYVGPKGETDFAINDELRKAKDQMDMVFKYFEINEKIPTPSEVTKMYKERMSGIMPKRPEPEPKKREQKPKEKPFWECFDQFCSEAGEKNSWTPATQEKMDALKVDLQAFKKNLSFSSLTESTLTAFVVYLRDTKKLRTPRKKKGDREDYDHEDTLSLVARSRPWRACLPVSGAKNDFTSISTPKPLILGQFWTRHLSKSFFYSITSIYAFEP